MLLDTCALIWAVKLPASLSPKAREIIGTERNVVLVSAASAWEIATKVRIGKLPDAEDLERDFIEVADAAGYILLPITPEQALRAGRIVSTHQDPFDRMLAAQALELDIPILSPDTQLDSLAVRRIW